MSRLGALHRSTKGEIRRLAHLLNAELDRPDPEGLTEDETSAADPGKPATS